MLADLQNMVNELNTTNSSNEKKEILAKYPQCKELLFYVYNPFYQFHVTSKNIKKRQDLVENCHLNIIEVLDKLKDRKVTGHKAIALVNSYIEEYPQYQELIYNIIDKDLKIRMDAKSINKVFPKCIPTFNVALANKYEDRAGKIDFEKEDWYASRKLDGVRCIIVKKGKDVSCWSRQGKQFHTLKVLEDSVKNLSMHDMILDGEVCLVDKDGNEDFQGIMKQIRKKDHIIKNPKYYIFDILDVEEFDNKSSHFELTKRYGVLKGELGQEIENLPHLEVLEQTKINDKEQLTRKSQFATDNKWEGLIIRKDVPYEGKRSNNLLKVKKMFDSEYVVKSVDVGPVRMINKDTGLEETITTVTNVNIEHKGNVVGVGSGFTLDERKQYYNDPQDIIGKTITVQYFEETKNQKGEYSLRFPIVKCIHGDRREV